MFISIVETGRGKLGGPMEHSKGKDGERTVAIPRLLCGRPRLCRLRTGRFCLDGKL
jgi:hypothetical protein